MAQSGSKQSALGIVALVLALMVCLLTTIDMYNAADLAAASTRLIVIIAMLCLSLLGLVLGIAGLSHSGRKGYAILGTMVNLLGLGWASLLLLAGHWI
jgi:hypothetical protein